jgi:hypothetical protein
LEDHCRFHSWERSRAAHVQMDESAEHSQVVPKEGMAGVLGNVFEGGCGEAWNKVMVLGVQAALPS